VEMMEAAKMMEADATVVLEVEDLSTEEVRQW